VFASLLKAAKALFDRRLSRLVIVSVALTILLYAALLAGALYGLEYLPALGWRWVNTLLEILAPVLVFLLIVYVGAAAAALFAPLFLDMAAKRIEARFYPADPATRDAGAGLNLITGLKLALVVIAFDLALLPADAFLPGIGETATILINGWLLGRGYFEMTAFRHVSKRAARALRSRHAVGVFAAGVAISLLSAVPLVNFIAPLFGAALMVHLFKRYAQKERPV
jgi:CysZ protein